MKNFASILLVSAGLLNLAARAEEPIAPIMPPVEQPDIFALSDRGGPTNRDPGVIGHTYMAMGVTKTIATDKCEVLVGKIKSKLVDPKFETKDFLYEYTFYCQEIQKGLKGLIVSLLVEPSTDKEIENLDFYRERVTGEDLFGMDLFFAPMKGIEIEKHISGIYYADKPQPLHQYELVSTNIQKFPNFHQYRMHVLAEKTLLRGLHDVNELESYLAKYLQPSEMKLFEDNALKKSNVIGIENSRRNVFMNNQKVEALQSDRAMAVCPMFTSGKFCMME